MNCQRCKKGGPLIIGSDVRVVAFAGDVTAVLCCACNTAVCRAMLASKEYREFRKLGSIQRAYERRMASVGTVLDEDDLDGVSEKLADAELALHDFVAKLVKPVEGK